MTGDERQASVPEAFAALYRDPRGRLTLPVRALDERHELCEDLAQHLVASAQGLHHDTGLPREEVLQRITAGLAQPDSGLSADEARWTVGRLGELLRWPSAPPAT
ncbi:hypothetical protein [Aquabacterium sp. J223]|uniref:hypothetical protein n=1 Tax=Aquabacterium sp. J223 TaxID=2898431 RepID=UPI0021ADEF32|nr:hypothetical protein [Aquabacterium sp. J223]UUX95597.1 hypothetical protein LRS07_20740 [Aquabacterium sp. J223]